MKEPATDELFNKYLETFVKTSGHQWMMGFYYETHSGETIVHGSEEHKAWVAEKRIDYDNTK